jgi:hypothetical protein
VIILLAILGTAAYLAGVFAVSALLLATLVTFVPAFHPDGRLDRIGRPFRNCYAIPLLRLMTGRRAPDHAEIAALEGAIQQEDGIPVTGDTSSVVITGNKSSSVYGGIVGYWTEEGAAFPVAASLTCPDCGEQIASLAMHQQPGSDCHQRHQWKLASRPSATWDEWCTCGEKFTSTIAKNERAIAAHRASGRCRHAASGPEATGPSRAAGRDRCDCDWCRGQQVAAADAVALYVRTSDGELAWEAPAPGTAWIPHQIPGSEEGGQP